MLDVVDLLGGKWMGRQSLNIVHNGEEVWWPLRVRHKQHDSVGVYFLRQLNGVENFVACFL
jgi:hypothetical protein